jgi:hypothetical protein
MYTLETLVICELLHDLQVAGRIQRFQSPGTEHEMSDAVERVTVE